jgi:C1A family cysteine protease
MRSPLTPWCGFLVVCVLCSLAPPMAVPQDVDRLGPINPEHVAYRDSVAAGTWSPVSPTGRGLGHIPPLFLTDPNLPPGRHIVGAYPDDYVLPAADLPSIRNQGACGSCWAFATYGSMETCGLVASDDGTDWSENHLKNNHGWDYTCCYGGHCFMSAAYFSRWDGPITEADDPYSTSCTGSSGTVQKHLESMWCLPTDDPSAIKDAIYQYGGVYTSYYNPGTGAYYNGTFTAYYYPPTGPQEVTSHAVTIVGWDDGYKRANFATDPGVDGAWFVRNSWGTFNSLGGYEWVSYNDKFMGKSLNALFLEPEATDNLAYCYEYDPLGEVVKWGSSTTGSYRWMANIFPRVAVGGQDRQQLEAIGFYTTSAANSYILEIRRNCNATGPRTGGTLAHNSSGTLTYEGYHTIYLDPPVDILAADTRFSVTIRVGTGAYQYALEYYYPGVASGATASAGQSFYGGSGGTSWTDLTSIYANTNFCIKAFAYPGPLPVRLSGFRAQGGHGNVRVTWKTANEVGTAGFIVVRSERPEGPFERIDGRVVAAEGQPGQVMQYEFIDETAQPGRMYYYRIREVFESGTINEHEDTVKAIPGGAGLYDLLPAQIRALLPL